MSPLPLDELRIEKLSRACDDIDEESPRLPDWRSRKDAAYTALAQACNRAVANARTVA